MNHSLILFWCRILKDLCTDRFLYYFTEITSNTYFPPSQNKQMISDIQNNHKKPWKLKWKKKTLCNLKGFLWYGGFSFQYKNVSKKNKVGIHVKRPATLRSYILMILKVFEIFVFLFFIQLQHKNLSIQYLIVLKQL